MNQDNKKSIFDQFTNQYSLTKTLRFELVPEGKTLDNMKKNLGYKEGKEDEFSTFLKDQAIEDAYQILKPVFDKIHEEFITKSLESDDAKNIDFSGYFDLYKELNNLRNKKNNLKDKKEKENIIEITSEEDEDKKLEIKEKSIREKFIDIYSKEAEKFREKVGKEKKTKGKEEFILKENGHKILTEAGILKYIKNNIDYFVDLKLKTIDEKIITKKDLEDALGSSNKKGVFENFFTYFGGFNQNRENYYATKEEKSTAVATRIVSQNLPMFCDNTLIFDDKKEEYLGIFSYLKNLNIDLSGKDKKSEKKDLLSFEDFKNIFDINYFNSYLSQNGIEEYNQKIGDANFLVNLYNQQKKTEEKSFKKEQRTFKKLKLFKTLYKQIGCGEKKEFIKLIKGEEDLKKTLIDIKENADKYLTGTSEENEEKYKLNDFINLIKERENYKGIYWNKTALNTISGKYFADWGTLSEKLVKEYKDFRPTPTSKNKEEKIRIPEAVELEDLFSVLDKDLDQNWRLEGSFFKRSVFDNDNYNEVFEKKIIEGVETKIIKNDFQKPSDALLNFIFLDLQTLSSNFFSVKGILYLNEEDKDKKIVKIKGWLDNIIAVQRILKYFITKENKRKGDIQDAEIENTLRNILEYNWFAKYDAVRNYLTKKDQEGLNKLKLNFENSTLAQGWDLNKEKDNTCLILQDKNKKQYLAVVKYEFSNIFEKDIKVTKKEKIKNWVFIPDDSGWQKMVYKLIPGANKTLPKVFFSKKWTGKNKTPSDIYEIYKIKKSFKKGDNFKLQDLHYLIDYFKTELKKYPDINNCWQEIYNFSFSATEKYESIDQFYGEVDKQGYKLDFIDINKSKIDELVDEGKIYLFKIKNKDFNLDKNVEKTSNQNLETIYWQSVFKNFENKPKLNGQAEIFYRPSLSEKKLDDLKTKDKNGKEIIKNYRFSKEKFIFHCPVTLNFGSKNTKINDIINNKIKDSTDLCFLGIDRGEKHLAYYSLVNQDGKILDQGTLNMPFLDKDGKQRTVKAKKYLEKDKKPDGTWEPADIECKDYNELLDARASNRDMARKNWQTIGNIKDLKDGYISQIVRKIVDLAIYEDAENKILRKVPAFIVLENLNIGFKRGRQKIEKQVYQKLELALAKKLNFLVDKKAKDGEIGSTTKALQLTPPVKTFGDIEGKSQFGIMLYTKADYTSQTDPVTGWRKSIYLKKGSEEYIKTQILNNFDDFGFDGQDYYFKYKDKNTGEERTMFSGASGKSLDRYYRELQYENFEKKGSQKKQDITERLDKIFANFDFSKEKSAKNQILDGDGLKLEKYRKEDQSPWDSLRFTIDLIQQIRNTGAGEKDEDFILSPVRDKNGNHFDSRKVTDYDKLPNSGDANGAYNIARKGIIMKEHIKYDLGLFIKDEEWDCWLAEKFTGKDVWKKWIEYNKQDLKNKKK